jgi:predicted nucleic acid-binding protein
MKVLFDSSIYVEAMRSGGAAGVELARSIGSVPVWCSSVVLEELYAGVSSRDRKIVDKLERDFERVDRVLVPSQRDWSRAGQLLRRIAGKYGFEHIGRSRLTNDALIATSAARAGITVFTVNARDFARLAEFCPVRWEVR